LAEPFGLKSFAATGSGSAIVSGHFTVFIPKGDPRHGMYTLFLLLEGRAGKFTVAHVEYDPATRKERGYFQEEAIDVIDIDHDGRPEIVTYLTAHEASDFAVYRKRGRHWRRIFVGGGGGCRASPKGPRSTRGGRHAPARVGGARWICDRQGCGNLTRMASTAIKLMTVEEFLVWDDRTDTRHELIDGRPVAMAPATRRHSLLAARLVGRLTAALADRPPCNVFAEAGIRSTASRRTFFVADIAVSCADAPDDSQELEQPVLIVEVLSPSTAGTDRRRKLFDYRQLPSVQEILLIDAAGVYCEVHRRTDPVWLTDILRDPDARLRLESVGLDLSLGDLYAGMSFDEAEAG